MRSDNLWLKPEIAIAYADQEAGRPHREMMKVIQGLVEPSPSQKWLDIGCGSGRLMQAIWEEAQGCVGEIIGLDCNPANEELIARRFEAIKPKPEPGQIRFILGDVSNSLYQFNNHEFDGVTAGLVLPYIENWDQGSQQWNDRAYLKVLLEIKRILKTGGQFVWTTDMPNPKFNRIFFASWREILTAGLKLPRALTSAYTLLKFSRWLVKSANQGRFHYHTIEQIKEDLRETGFHIKEIIPTYAGVAWAICCDSVDIPQKEQI